jgi:hypothetical protein
MTKVIRLTESDLVRIVKRVINEETEDITGPNSACRKAVTYKLLWEAKQWWINRLSIDGGNGKRTPNTNIMSKILYQKYKITDLASLLKNDPKKGKQYYKEASDLVMKAVDFVKNIKFVFENQGVEGLNNIEGAAWVSSEDKQIVHISCEYFSNPIYQKDNTFIKNILVHEIQHSIDQFFGYGMDIDFGGDMDKQYKELKKLTDWSQKPMTNDKITYMDKELAPTIKKSSPDEFVGRYDSYYNKDLLSKPAPFKDKEYNCDSTEIQSRYTETKRILGLPPSVDLTINHLKSNSEAYMVFYRNLLCWASRTDNVSLDTFMKNINLLVAKNQTGGNDQNIT